ncbi:MAG TPA: M13 family metallopeptidase [Gemmatimonadaceae bacterium]
MIGRLLLAAAVSLPAAAVAGAQQTSHVFDHANMDTTCAACTDFYEYANGNWIKNAVIPPTQSGLSSFGTLSNKNRDAAHQIVSDDSAAVKSGKAKSGSEQWKIGAYYTSCMDTTAIDARGIAPLKPELDAIAAIKTVPQLVKSFGASDRRGGLAPFNVSPGADPKASTQTIVSASQGGLGLPEREYYFRTDAHSQGIRKEYVAHVGRTLQLIGESADQATKDADHIMALETSLAKITQPRLRDPNAFYHKMSITDFGKMTPHIDWKAYLAQVGGQAATVINVRNPSFFTGLDSLLTTVPIDDWKAYLRWHAANAASPMLGNKFADEGFAFTKVMRGVKQPQPRWETCLGTTQQALGWAVGHEFVNRKFSPEAKARAAQMVDNLVSALRDRINQLDWMSAATKKQAVGKLDAYLRKIAYPDTWRDYSALAVKPGQYFENVEAQGHWNRQRTWARVGKPVDRTEWSMTPTTVNASYSSSLNQIQFPAGILFPPFFDPTADDAVNYGALGAVIGHEMSHGFDDQGRQFDAQGNLRDWWTPEDAAKYKAATQKMVHLYNGFTVIDSATHVNGTSTLGENIGDFGGLTVAYAAMEKALAKKGRPGKIDGFTPEQRFFLSWAQIWREKQSDEAERLQVNTNPHSPGKWRVNGPLSMMPEFAKAFGCKTGDPMVLPDSLRARIW